MQKTMTICDVCGTVKQESNHWFKVQVQNFRFQVEPFNPFGDYSADSSDACSDSCVLKLLSRWLTDKKSAADAANADPVH